MSDFAETMTKLTSVLEESTERAKFNQMHESAFNDFLEKAMLLALNKIGERLNAIDKRLDDLESKQ